MNSILEQKMPPEVVMNVLKFCRPPIAELLQQLIGRHEHHKEGFRTHCEKKGVPYKSHILEFPMVIFMDRRIQRGTNTGRDPKNVVDENRYIIKRYC